MSCSSLPLHRNSVYLDVVICKFLEIVLRLERSTFLHYVPKYLIKTASSRQTQQIVATTFFAATFCR